MLSHSENTIACFGAVESIPMLHARPLAAAKGNYLMEILQLSHPIQLAQHIHAQKLLKSRKIPGFRLDFLPAWG